MLSEKEIATILLENDKLKKLVEKQEELISKSEVVISEKDAKITEKDYLIARLQRMLFGQKRERFELPNNQLDIFQEILTEKQAALEELFAEKIEVTYQK